MTKDELDDENIPIGFIMNEKKQLFVSDGSSIKPLQSTRKIVVYSPQLNQFFKIKGKKITKLDTDKYCCVKRINQHMSVDSSTNSITLSLPPCIRICDESDITSIFNGTVDISFLEPGTSASFIYSYNNCGTKYIVKLVINKKSALPSYLTLYDTNRIQVPSPGFDTPVSVTYDTEGPIQGSLLSPTPATPPYTGISVNTVPSTFSISYSISLAIVLSTTASGGNPAIVDVESYLNYGTTPIKSGGAETSIVTSESSSRTYLVTLGNTITYTATTKNNFNVTFQLMNTGLATATITDLYIDGANINVIQI